MLSGLIDKIDGQIARVYTQTSELGYVMDLGVDRICSSAILFFCTTVYPKYWYIFLSIQFCELFSDIMKLAFQVHSNFVNSFTLLINSNEFNYYSIGKANLYEQAGISYLLNKNDTKIVNVEKVENKFNLFSVFIPYVWYSSDLFFWLIYFGAFISKLSLLSEFDNDLNSNKKFNDKSSIRLNINNDNILNQTKNLRRLNFLKRAIFDLFSIFEEMAKFVEKIIISKFKSLKFLKFNLLFRVLCSFCAICAFLKLYFNIETIWFCLIQMVDFDERLYNQLEKLNTGNK